MMNPKNEVNLFELTIVNAGNKLKNVLDPKNEHKNFNICHTHEHVRKWYLGTSK